MPLPRDPNSRTPPPSIGFLRGQGVTAARIVCAGTWCGRQAIIAFDDMRLSDETPFPEVAQARRWVCSKCGSRSVRAQPDWPDPQEVQAARMQAANSSDRA